jgi:thymidylate synthase (FAD)
MSEIQVERFPAVKLLDHGYLKIVESWGSEERIIEAARMSTQAGFKGWGWEECTFCGDWPTQPKTPRRCPDSPNGEHDFKDRPGDEKLLCYLWENKHHTPFEMAGLTVEVQAPIFVFREWHRHRVPFSYNEASARYAPLPALDYVPTVERLMAGGGHLTKQAGSVAGAEPLTEESAQDFRHELADFYATAEDLYQHALRRGVPKELARCVLPVARYSRMRASSNLRGWLAFLALRAHPAAQREIRLYAEALQDILSELFPRTLALFAEGQKR